MEDKKVLPKVNLSTENYDIISTGSVVLQMGEFLEFEIENLKFRIEFIDEPIIDGVTRDGKITTGVVNTDPNNTYFRIALYNQDSAFFSSTPDFVNVASFDGRPLRLKFSVQPINNRDGSSDKIFFYTWYLGKDVSIQTTDNVPQ